MALPSELTALIAAHDFAAVEDRWLARLDDEPLDLEWFAQVARAVAKAGDAGRAKTLLEMVDDALEEGAAWDLRLAFLRQSGDLYVAAEKLHKTIVRTVERLHGEQASYKPMAEKLGLFRAVDDIPKIWAKVERLRVLLAFDVGTIVRMEGKGAGRVVDVNMTLESFKVRFEKGPELQVGFHAAAKLLAPLSEGHLLRRKLEDPEGLVRLRDADPSALLRLALQDAGGPRTTTDIKADLAGIVSEERWNAFWNAARRHPQVVASSRGKAAYTWAESTADAHGTLWLDFQKADAPGQLELLRRHADRDAGLRERMTAALAETAAAVVRQQPALAAEIALTLERSGAPPAATAPWSPAKLLAHAADPLPIVAGINDRALRERGYVLLAETREDWRASYEAALRQETDPRSLDLLLGRLREADAEVVARLVDELTLQPRRAPAAFVWLAERASEDAELAGRNPHRLLRQILRSQADERFASFRARLAALVESGSTVPRLLPLLAEEQAAQALEAIDKAPGLLDYQRQPLVAALELRFPSLRQQAEAPLYATRESIAAKRAELQELLEKEIPANRKAIQEARELGDLRENFEYKSARQRHEYLAVRAAALDRDLNRVRPIDPAVDGTEVVIGSRVHLRGDGRERVITILGPWESRPEDDVLSDQSEAAQALLGLGVGDGVKVAGEAWTIAKIEPYASADGPASGAR